MGGHVVSGYATRNGRAGSVVGSLAEIVSRLTSRKAH